MMPELIKKIFAKKINVMQGAVSKILRKHAKYKTVERFEGSGRPDVFTIEISESIESIRKEKPINTLRKIGKQLNKETGEKVSHMTIKRFLNLKKYDSFSPRKRHF
jgi:hypothetical protein